MQSRCVGGQPSRQATAFDELHGEVGVPGVFPDVVNLHDVGVTHAGGGVGFDSKAAELLRSGQGAVADHLEGEDAAGAEVAGFVDDAHAAAAEFSEQFVAGEGGSGR